MLFVFLSHFGEVYFIRNKAPLLLELSRRIGMVASPLFIIISGLLLGFFFETRKAQFGKIRARLIDRGIFLLTIGHILILIAHIPFAGGVEAALHWAFMTDTIGFCLIVGPLLITRLRPKARIIFCAGVYVLSWLIILYWQPTSTILRLIEDTLFGQFEGASKIYADNFPLLPWFSLYFISSCLGEWVGKYSLEMDITKLARLFLRVVLASSGSLLLIYSGMRLARPLLINSPTIHMVISPWQKLPPGPVYFLFYGGIGLTIMYSLLKFEKRYFIKKFSIWASILGKTSLFIFVLQYYVYFSLYSLLDLSFTFLWPLYFTISIAIIFYLAKIWHEKNYNRFMTVNYSHMVERLHI